jgi:SulP family sulfate permease
MFHGSFVLAVALLFSRLVAWVPIAALAGILFVVAWRMFDRSSFKLLRQKSTVLDFVVIFAVVATAVGYSLVAAAGVGLLLAIFLFIREQMQSSVIRRKVYGHQMSSKKHRLDSEKELLVEAGQQVAICELQGSLFFGTTDRLYTEVESDLTRCKYVILDMRRVVTVDYTGAHMLDLFEAQLAEHGGHLLLSGIPAQLPSGQDLESYFAHLGVTRESKKVRVFDTLNDAVEWVEDQLLDEARPPASLSGRAFRLEDFELFREFEEDQTLDALRGCITEVSFKSGETIFQHGDAGAEAYLIRRGGVRVFVPLASGKQLTLATYGRGHFFGDMAFLDRRPRSATAAASEDTDLYVLHRDRFDEIAHGHEVAAIKTFARLACTLAQRLRHTDAELRALQDA